MSYRRRYRRGYKRKRYPSKANRWGRYLSTASKALAVAYAVKKMVNVEYKYHDYNLNTVLGSPPTTGLIDCINEIPQGDTSINREGDQCKMVSLQIKGKITQDSNNTTKGSQVRLILFLVTAADDTEPTVATGEQGFLTSLSIIGLRNLGAPRNRYVPLWDKVFYVAPYGEERDHVHFKYFKKMSYKARFKDNTTDHPRKNALYMIAISTDVTDVPLLEGAARIRFIDN